MTDNTTSVEPPVDEEFNFERERAVAAARSAWGASAQPKRKTGVIAAVIAAIFVVVAVVPLIVLGQQAPSTNDPAWRALDAYSKQRAGQSVEFGTQELPLLSRAKRVTDNNGNNLLVLQGNNCWELVVSDTYEVPVASKRC